MKGKGNHCPYFPPEGWSPSIEGMGLTAVIWKTRIREGLSKPLLDQTPHRESEQLHGLFR